MDHAKKLDFIHKMTKMGLEHVQHFDDGGTVLGGPTQQGAVNAGGIFGLGSTNIKSAPIQAGTNAAQLNQSYNQAQSGINQQQGIANTLTPGVASGFSAQNQLAAQLAAQANGQGPNVAQNQLNQATGANVANQAALMAGQRGSGANAGLLARQAAQQGANTQQQAVGQAATLGAQQQLAAQQQQQALANQMIGQGAGAVQGVNTVAQGEQGILQNANNALNQANIANTGQMNQSAVSANNAALQGITGALGGIGKGLSAGAGFLGNLFSSSPATPDSTTVFAGPDMGAGTAPAAKQKVAHGGMIQHFAGGGQPTAAEFASGEMAPQDSTFDQAAAAAAYMEALNNQNQQAAPPAQATPNPYMNYAQFATRPHLADGGSTDLATTATNFFDKFKKADGGMMSYAVGGEIPDGMHAHLPEHLRHVAMIYGHPDKNPKLNKNTQLKAVGGNVKANSPEQKAKVKDNSIKNDKIPAMLSEGEIVIPRDIVNHPNAPAKAAEFVRMTLAKKGLRK